MRFSVRFFPSHVVALLLPNSAALSNQYLPFPVLSSASASADLASSSESCFWASVDPEAVGFLVESTGPEASFLVRAGWVERLCQFLHCLKMLAEPLLFVTSGNYNVGVITCPVRPERLSNYV